MTTLLIAITVVIVAAAIVSTLLVRRATRDPLDRRAARMRVSKVLTQAVASVPANAFDARMRIVRNPT